MTRKKIKDIKCQNITLNDVFYGRNRNTLLLRSFIVSRENFQFTKGVFIHLKFLYFRNLLHNSSYNPRVICWTDEENGCFKVVNTLEFAQTWGKMKTNRWGFYQKVCIYTLDTWASDTI